MPKHVINCMDPRLQLLENDDINKADIGVIEIRYDLFVVSELMKPDRHFSMTYFRGSGLPSGIFFKC